MAIQGVLLPDHAPINSFEFIVLGVPPITFLTLDGVEEEVEQITMPDRTMASGGNTKPVEFTGVMPLHHSVELAALEVWYNLGKGDVTQGYKKDGTMIYKTIGGNIAKIIPMTQIWIPKRKYPDLDIENDGELAKVTWTFSAKVIL